MMIHLYKTDMPSDLKDIPAEKVHLLFALLFSSPDLVGLDRIRNVLYPEGEDSFSPKQHLEALENYIVEKELPLKLHQVGRGYRLLTSENFADVLASSRKASQKEKLGAASLEVLALVAYRQPVLKADIDAIRGVKSGPHLRHLLDMHLVKITGRAELPGRPFLYGTTREFLDKFGLRDLKELPESGRLSTPHNSQGEGSEEVAETASQD